MRNVLLLAGIIEIIGGLLLYVNPNLIFVDPHILSTRFYSLAALVIGSLCVFAYRDYHESRFFKTFYLTMMFFHGALSMICFQDSIGALTFRDEAIISHLIIFSIFVIAYLKDLKPE